MTLPLSDPSDPPASPPPRRTLLLPVIHSSPPTADCALSPLFLNSDPFDLRRRAPHPRRPLRRRRHARWARVTGPRPPLRRWLSPGAPAAGSFRRRRQVCATARWEACSYPRSGIAGNRRSRPTAGRHRNFFVTAPIIASIPSEKSKHPSFPCIESG